MRYRLADIPALLRTPVGRAAVRGGVLHRTWPLLARLAMGYRATLVRRTRVVAVVGTFGKTTTARAVTIALGNDPGPNIPGNAFAAAAREVLRIRPRDRRAVIEIAISRPGLMRTYARMVHPDVAVVTSVGS